LVYLWMEWGLPQNSPRDWWYKMAGEANSERHQGTSFSDPFTQDVTIPDHNSHSVSFAHVLVWEIRFCKLQFSFNQCDVVPCKANSKPTT
jgi:hypothetical protein